MYNFLCTLATQLHDYQIMLHLSNYKIKAKILSNSFISARQVHSPYKDIMVSTDMTNVEQIRHTLLVEQLKSWRAGGKTHIIIHGDNIVTRYKFQKQQTGKQKSRSGSLESQLSWVTYISWKKYSSVMDRDNTNSFHQAAVDPDHLCDPQVI